MNKHIGLPEWSNRDFTSSSVDVAAAATDVVIHQEQFLFTGIAAEFVRSGRYPIAFQALLVPGQQGLLRIEFEEGGDGVDDDGRLRAVYSQLAPEAFALMWNLSPDYVHGIRSDRITLNVQPSDESWPTVSGRIQSLLTFDGSEFRIGLDEDYYASKPFPESDQ